MALSWNFDDMPDQTGRTIVVTGATSGLGRIAAAELAARGATVLMAVRDVAKGERVRSELAESTPAESQLAADPGSQLAGSASAESRSAARPGPRQAGSGPEESRSVAGPEPRQAHLAPGAPRSAAGPGPRRISGHLEVHRLDLADLGSVRAFAASLGDRPIDVLINNAGTGGRERRLTANGHEEIIATNHLGPFALTGLLLGNLRRGRDARIVTVGSNFYRRATADDDLAATGSYHPLRQYVQSKLANVLFAGELDRRLRAIGSPVRSYAAHPGMAWTGMQSDPGGPLARAAMAVMGGVFARSAEDGTLPILFAATDERARTGVFLGPSQRKWDKRVHFAPVVAPGNDVGRAARQWAIAEAATGVRYLDEVRL